MPLDASATEADTVSGSTHPRRGWRSSLALIALIIGVVPGFEVPTARADGDGGEGAGCWLCEEWNHNGLQVHEDRAFLTDSKDGDPHWNGIAGTCAFYHNPYKAPPKGGGGPD